ncbi:leucine-rich repeat protein 1 isoform X1 [Gopherus evgoodei]|uniref:leucine-rich repeat protein 1 isoform X1 n=1 Tax=Gopherus evgoodei TaxID=1825980 RepID=UPI0011CF0236|nr:leucine-rich repeat protein 1 isoform X1 [Gopherus evgoodei]
MRLQCEVEVRSRLLPTCGLRGRAKGARALLSLGRRPDRPPGHSVYLMVCTARDRAGARYKLKENIEQFFTKFVEEGKATVRLKEPAVDVCLSKANASNLKSFLAAVRLAHRGTDVEALPLSVLVPAKTSEVEKPKTKMIIMSRRDYPLTKNFPYSLEHLQASYCKLARVDMRMLCLKKLRTLDLSHNHIKKLPETIGDLVSLQELNLHNNHLESFCVALCNSMLQKSLQFLDLSQNKIKALPVQFCQLQELIHLKLDDNELIRLPFKMGQLSQLRFLSAARNKLPFLPSDFRNLSLEKLDLFGNPFEQPNPLVPSIQLKIPLTLLESAARATVNYRIPYGCHLLPSHLWEDLELAKTCQCGSACLSCFIQTTVTMNLHHVAHTVVLVDNMGGELCTVECFSICIREGEGKMCAVHLECKVGKFVMVLNSCGH